MGEHGLPLGRLVDGRAGGRSGGHRAERTPAGCGASGLGLRRFVGSMHRDARRRSHEGWNRRRASLYSPRPRSTIEDPVRPVGPPAPTRGNGEHSDRRHSPDPRDGRPRVGRQRRAAHQHLASRPGPRRRPDRRGLRHRPGRLHRRGRRPRRPREGPEPRARVPRRDGRGWRVHRPQRDPHQRPLSSARSPPTGELARADDWTVSPIMLRHGCSVGAGAVVVAGTDVGPFATVGAGAIVTRDVPAHALVVGSPARRIGWVCACGARLVARVTDSARRPQTTRATPLSGVRRAPTRSTATAAPRSRHEAAA